MRRVKPLELTCDKCKVKFQRPIWQHKANLKRGRTNVYCSMACASNVHRRPIVVRKTESERIEAARKAYTEACPACGEHFLKVISTRITGQGYRRRSKHCQNCDHRVITIEVPEEVLEGHLSSKTKMSQPKPLISCMTCEHNNRDNGECGWGFPEYMTKEAFDCNHFTQAS